MVGLCTKVINILGYVRGHVDTSGVVGEKNVLGVEEVD